MEKQQKALLVKVLRCLAFLLVLGIVCYGHHHYNCLNCGAMQDRFAFGAIRLEAGGLYRDTSSRVEVIRGSPCKHSWKHSSGRYFWVLSTHTRRHMYAPIRKPEVLETIEAIPSREKRLTALSAVTGPMPSTAVVGLFLLAHEKPPEDWDEWWKEHEAFLKSNSRNSPAEQEPEPGG